MFAVLIQSTAFCIEIFLALPWTSVLSKTGIYSVCVTSVCAAYPQEPLSVLSETLQRCGRAAPEPRLLRSAGPGSLLAAYVVGIYTDRKLLSYGG